MKLLATKIEIPNATTQEAIAELESGEGRRFESVDALLADLNADEDGFQA